MGVPSEKYLSQIASNVPSALIFARYSFVFARSSLSLEFTPKAYSSSERAMSITLTFSVLPVFPQDARANTPSTMMAERIIERTFFIFVFSLINVFDSVCAVCFFV